MLCSKFGWNWPSQCIFAISLLSSRGKWRDPSFELNWIPFTQEWFVLNLVEIGSVVLLKFANEFLLFRYYLPWKGCDPSFEQNWNPFAQECFVSLLVEIGPGVLEKKMYNSNLSMYFRYYIPLQKGFALHLKKLEITSHKDPLAQVS